MNRTSRRRPPSPKLLRPRGAWGGGHRRGAASGVDRADGDRLGSASRSARRRCRRRPGDPPTVAGIDRRRGPSSAGRLRAPGVELVLEDDGGGLAVDPGAVRVALGGRRRAARAAALHRSEALLGEMAGQTLVAERDWQAHEG